MWELGHEESWAPKNWRFWTVVLKKTLESPLDCKEIQPVHSKEISPGCSLEGIMLKLKLQYWPPHVKSWLIGKEPDAGRDWEHEDKGTTEDGMTGWHHWLDGHEFEWTPLVGDGEGGLVCSIYGVKKSRTRLSAWTGLNWTSWAPSGPTILPLQFSRGTTIK